jgi:hypothetical protein
MPMIVLEINALRIEVCVKIWMIIAEINAQTPKSPFPVPKNADSRNSNAHPQ